MRRRGTGVAGTLAMIGGAMIAAAGVGSLVWAGLIPGGGPQASDCYLEFDVQGVDSPGAQVTSGRVVACADGDACDADGVCGNDACTLRVAVCVAQQDPNLPACTPPSALRRLKVHPRIRPGPILTAGSACGSFVDVPLQIRVRRNGTRRPGKIALPGNAVAAKGTTPARDRDKLVLECVPPPGGCPGAAPSTTSTTLPGLAATTVTVGPGGELRFDPATVEIRVGDTVRWRFATPLHNVVSGSGGSANGLFCSPDDSGCASAPFAPAGSTYEHTFSEPGTFPYFCQPHVSVGMTGRVIVEP